MLRILRKDMMERPKRKYSHLLAAASKVAAAIAVVAILAPVLRNLNTISSDEVETLLYKYLDRYNARILSMSDTAELIMSAETDPTMLSVEERRRYLLFQRKFFDQWEAARTYYRADQLAAERWQVWNSWFIAETRRRPLFGWVENRIHFSGSFSRHVDESLGILHE